MIRKMLKRPLSMLMAVTMVLSNLSGTGLVLAEEMETEITSFNETEESADEAETVVETEAAVTETEAVPELYSVTLPYYDGCGYVYDKDHVTEVSGKDIILGYYADESVKLTINPAENVDITGIHVYTPQKLEPAYSWNDENGKLSFEMPDTDLMLELTLAEIIQETSAEEPAYVPADGYVEEPEAVITEQDMEITFGEDAVTQIQEEHEISDPMVSVEAEKETESREAESFEIITEADGYPAQGSIYQVDTISIAYDTWDFDPKTDFTGISYDQDEFTLSYLSDDVDYVTPGVYSSIYRIQQKNTERMWYILRPVRVCEKNETIEAATEVSIETEAPVAETVEDASESDEDPDPEEITEAITETESLSETELTTKDIEEAADEEETEAVEETAESETEAVTETLVVEEDEDTEAAETEEAVIVEDDTISIEEEVIDLSALEEVSEEEMYYLSLPEIGATEVLKKHRIWKGDTGFDQNDIWPETDTIAKADVELYEGAVNIEKTGNYSVVFLASLKEDPQYYWYIEMPYEVVEDKADADILSEEAEDMFFVSDLGDKSHIGELPEKVGDIVKAEDITVIRGEEFNLLDVNFDYDWDVFGLDLMDDGGFDYNKTGRYHVVYEVFAWQDLSQTFLLECNVTVKEMENQKGTILVHVASGELVADVVPDKGDKQTAKYGEDVTVSGSIDSIMIRSAYDREIEPEFMVYKDGEVIAADELISKEKAGDNTLKLVLKNIDPESYYQVDLMAPAFHEDGKADKRSEEWVDIEDEDYVPEEKNEGGISSFFSGLLTASPFAITAEAAAASKKWTGKSTIVKSLQTYGADSGYSEVGAKSKAHVYLKDSLRTAIKTWIVDTQGLDLEGKIPTVIDVKCCSPGLWGWYSSGALSSCCSGVSLTATIETNSAGEATKVKLYLKCTGASGFQSFSGTVRIPVSEGGGELRLKKKSTSDNFIKTFTDLKIDTTFMVYDDAACTKEVADIDIDPKSDVGTSVTATIELDEGTYYVVETHRMAGHIWNTQKYKVVIKNGETTDLTVENEPFYFNGIFLEKKGSDGKALAGAVFKVTAVRKEQTVGTWYFKSDANGKVAYDEAHYVSTWNGKKSDALIMMNETIGAALPNSCKLTVEEVEAPAGYLLDTTVRTVGVSTSADGTEYKTAKLICTPLAVTNKKDEGYLKLVKKDSELGAKTPNSKFYSLAGAVYTVYDSSSKSVGTLTTKADGTTNTLTLPTGTYTVKETTAPEGYTLNKDAITVKLTTNHTSTAPYTVNTTDEAEHGKMKIHKIAEETEPSAIWAKRDLSGVKFKLTYLSDTSITRTVTTDAKGYATVTGLYLGDWKIEEITPPKYHAAIEAETITIDDTSIQEAEIENVRYEAELTLVKKEAGTGNIVKRAGAKFQIIDEVGKKVSLKVKGASSATDTFETNADGKVTFDEKIPAGKYTLKEIATPAGYQMGSDVEFEVANNKAVTVEMKDERATYTNVKVTKKDTVSGNIAGAGFEFGLYAESNILDGSGAVYAGYEKGKLLESAVTGNDGTATFTKKLYPGNYVIKETKAAKGYQLNTKDTIRFEVTEKAPVADGGNWTCEVKVLSGDGTFTFKNDPAKAPLKVIKKDANSGNPAGAGFVFELYAEKVVDGSGKVRAGFEKGTLIETLTTDERSVALSKDLYAGTYLLKEVSRTENYELNTNIFTVNIDPTDKADELFSITVKDEPLKKKIQVTKIDEETGNRCGAGFVFTIYAAEDICDASGKVYDGLHAGDIAGTMTTDEKGIAVSPELVVGKYLVQETAVPESGYSINTEKYPVELTDEKDADGKLIDKEKQTLVVEMDDIKDKPVTLHIKKLDAVDGKNLKGIIFRVKEEGAEDKDDQLYETDENGEITVKYLKKERTYLITEVKTIPGYNLNTEVFKAVVDENGLIEGSFEYSMTVENQPNTTEVSKVDITNSEELPGASLKITDKDGNVIDEWISGEEPHIIYGMPAGEYILTEIASPEKYEEAESVEFVITDTLEVQKVVMKDSPFRKVEVSKQDITNEAEVPGCTLTIKDAEGEVVDTWISEEEPHMVELHSGTYTLIEEQPAEKYEEAEEVTFEVVRTTEDDYEIQAVVMKDSPFRKVQISKKDITGEEEIPGCTLTIKDAEGEVVDTWVSEEEPHMTELHSGTYTLVEEKPAPGYVTAEEVAFEVIQTTAEDFEVSHVEMKDDITKVTISKKDITTSEELPGATLTITDSEGNVVETWVSEEEPHYIEKLPIGTYTLTEEIAPDYYSKAEAVTFEVSDTGEIQTVEMFDKKIEVAISKKDITTEKELPGAKLEVKDDKGNVIETWVSTEEEHMINLKTGTYTLTEITAPEGYEVAETITFEVTDSLEVQHVEMFDSPKETYIDLTGKKQEYTTGGTPGTPGTNVTTGPVKTGDQFRYLAAILLVLFGTITGSGLFISRKKKGKKDR